jgi:hypothetical protein
VHDLLEVVIASPVLSGALVLGGKGKHRGGDRGDAAATDPTIGDGHGL